MSKATDPKDEKKGRRVVESLKATAPAPAERAGPGVWVRKADGDAPTPPPTTPPARELLQRIKQAELQQEEADRAAAELLARQAKEAADRANRHVRLRRDMERLDAFVQLRGVDPHRAITEIPPVPDGSREVEFATVHEGRSFVRILFNAADNEYVYEVIEPRLTEAETQALDFLRETLIRTLDARQGEPAEWEQHLIEAVNQAIVDHSILVDEVSKQRLLYHLLRDFLGFGEIEALMRDPMIEDISCDGPRIPIYLFHRLYESVRTNVVFATDQKLDRYVVRLAQRSGKHISIADPLLDATLPDGSRLQASLSKEVTTRGSSFTIRKFRSDPLTPPDLVRIGTMSAEMAAYFWMAMEAGSSILYAGGTASGKTTTLNAVSLFIPPQKKIVSIEDTREINLPHQNWIAGLTRSGFGGEVMSGAQAGVIDMYKLLEAALRQRPEYLIVGEVRGPEANTLFQAMATGHATYSTLHADSVPSAVYRLENPPISVPRIMLQNVEAIAVQVQARIKDRLARRIKDVTEVMGVDPATGDIETNQVFAWDSATDTFRFLGKSYVFDTIRARSDHTEKQVEDEWRRRTVVMEWMVQQGIRKLREVADVISEYYRHPEALMAKAHAAPPPKPARGA